MLVDRMHFRTPGGATSNTWGREVGDQGLTRPLLTRVSRLLDTTRVSHTQMSNLASVPSTKPCSPQVSTSEMSWVLPFPLLPAPHTPGHLHHFRSPAPTALPWSRPLLPHPDAASASFPPAHPPHAAEGAAEAQTGTGPTLLRTLPRLPSALGTKPRHHAASSRTRVVEPCIALVPPPWAFLSQSGPQPCSFPAARLFLTPGPLHRPFSRTPETVKHSGLQQGSANYGQETKPACHLCL